MAGPGANIQSPFTGVGVNLHLLCVIPENSYSPKSEKINMYMVSKSQKAAS